MPDDALLAALGARIPAPRLRCALALEALREGARVLRALGDQPPLDPAVVAEVLGAPPAPIVVPCYRGVRGHPVRFDAALVPELLAASGDRDRLRESAVNGA